jgi:hypothetical protein
MLHGTVSGCLRGEKELRTSRPAESSQKGASGIEGASLPMILKNDKQSINDFQTSSGWKRGLAIWRQSRF